MWWCYKQPCDIKGKNHTCNSGNWTPVSQELQLLLQDDSSSSISWTSPEGLNYRIEREAQTWDSETSQYEHDNFSMLVATKSRCGAGGRRRGTSRKFTENDEHVFDRYVRKLAASRTTDISKEKVQFHTLLLDSLIGLAIQSCVEKKMTLYRLTGVEEMDNPTLLAKYLLCKKEMKNKSEVICFHGSKGGPVDLAAICNDGFDLRLAKNGVLGKGIYGARDASLSLGSYSFLDRDTKIGRSFLWCDVLSAECPLRLPTFYPESPHRVDLTVCVADKVISSRSLTRAKCIQCICCILPPNKYSLAN